MKTPDNADAIIASARKRRTGESEIPFVLSVARATHDHNLLVICLDCFRTVLQDSQSEYAAQVVRFLGELLCDPVHRRIRCRTLRTAMDIGRACHSILPAMVATYQRPATYCTWKWSRWAILSICWDILFDGDKSQRIAAADALAQLKGWGVGSLQLFAQRDDCDPDTRALIEVALNRIAAQRAGGQAQDGLGK
jgi:hypothetical protein